MEAIAAFGLACNVIQVVNFSVDTVKFAYDAYSTDQPRQNHVLEQRARELSAPLKSLQASKSNVLNGDERRTAIQSAQRSVSSEDGTSVASAAERCDKKAVELLKVLSGLKVDKEASRIRKAFKAVKAPVKRTKISDLQTELEQLQRQVELHVIAEIRKSCSEASRGLVQGFEDMREDHKTIILAIAENQTRLEVRLHNNCLLRLRWISSMNDPLIRIRILL